MENNLPSSKLQQSPIKPIQPKKSYTWLLILVLFLLVGISGYVTWKKFQLKNQLAQVVQPSAEPSPLIDPTAGWNSYAYKDIQFKYPNNWVLVTEKITAVRPADLAPGNEFPAVTFAAIDNPNNLSIKDYDEQASKEGPDPAFYSSFIGDKEVIAEEQIIDGIKGYYLKDQNCEPLSCDKFTFNYNSKIYVFSNIFGTLPDQPKADKVELRKIFDQILSTFKFTENQNLLIDDKVEVENFVKEKVFEYGKSHGLTSKNQIIISVSKIENGFASGNTSFTADVEGGGSGWIAIKVNGQWILVDEFQEPPSCQKMQQYNVPQTIYESCIDK